MSEKTPGRVEAISRNKAALAISHDDGWTVVELKGREGEIAIGDAVLGDRQAVQGEDLIFDGENFRAYFQGTGTKQWALKQIANWGGS